MGESPCFPWPAGSGLLCAPVSSFIFNLSLPQWKFKAVTSLQQCVWDVLLLVKWILNLQIQKVQRRSAIELEEQHPDLVANSKTPDHSLGYFPLEGEYIFSCTYCIILHYVVQGHFYDSVSGTKGVSECQTSKTWTAVWGVCDGFK